MRCGLADKTAGCKSKINCKYVLEKRSLLLETNFPNKHPTQKAEIKITQRNSFLANKKYILCYVQIYLNLEPRPFKKHNAYCRCHLKQSSTRFGTVCHHSITLHPTWDQINQETKIAPRHSNPRSNYLVFPTQTVRLPHPGTVNDAVCYDYVM